MPHRHGVLVNSALVLVLLVACSSKGIDVSTTFDPLAPFPAQASYVWDDQANRLPTDPRLQQMDLGPLLAQAASEGFAARGYRQAVSGSANYRLSYQLVVHTWIGADNSRSVGSLSVLLVDTATDRRVWMGFGRAEIDVGLSRAERLDRLRAVMERILEDFPPNQG